MIKEIALKSFAGYRDLPAYAYREGATKYTLTARLHSGYVITLAELKLADLKNAKGEHMAYAVFKSYTNHGEKMIETKARVDGQERQFMAVMNVMIKAGIIFDKVTPCHFLDLLNELGVRYKADNPDIAECRVMSQMCH